MADDVAKPDVKPINPPKDESNEPKTCQQAYSGMPQCRYLNGFSYYKSRNDAQKAFGWFGLKLTSEQKSYKGTCIGYSRHWNIRDPKRGNQRVGSLVDCRCCEDRGILPTIRTLYKSI